MSTKRWESNPQKSKTWALHTWSLQSFPHHKSQASPDHQSILTLPYSAPCGGSARMYPCKDSTMMSLIVKSLNFINLPLTPPKFLNSTRRVKWAHPTSFWLSASKLLRRCSKCLHLPLVASHKSTIAMQIFSIPEIWMTRFPSPSFAHFTRVLRCATQNHECCRL